MDSVDDIPLIDLPLIYEILETPPPSLDTVPLSDPINTVAKPQLISVMPCPWEGCAQDCRRLIDGHPTYSVKRGS